MGLRVTSPTRTLIDLGKVLDAERVEQAVEYAFRHGMSSPDYLMKRLALFGRRGCRGPRVLREVMERRAKDGLPTGSYFETLLFQTLRKARLPLPLRQHPVFDEDGLIGRLDFAYPDQKRWLEAQGYEDHSKRDRWHLDIQRRNRLSRLGWSGYEVTARALKTHPHDVARQVAGFLGHHPLF